MIAILAAGGHGMQDICNIAETAPKRKGVEE